MVSDNLIIDGKKFASRLIMGTSLYPNLEVMNKSLELSETQIITVAIRRLNLSSEGNFLDQLKKGYILTKHCRLFYSKRSNFNCRIS